MSAATHDPLRSLYALDIGGRRAVEFVLASIAAFRARHPGTPVRVLDVGCGTGQLTRLVAALDGVCVLGIDVDEESLALARASGQALPHLSFLCSSFEDFVAREPYDVAVMTQVLDHVVDPWSAIGKAAELLAPGGELLVGVSNGYGLYEISKDLCPGLIKRASVAGPNARALRDLPFTCNRKSPHLHKFSIGGLRALLERPGLSVVEVERVTFALPAFPLNAVYYWSPKPLARLFELLDHQIARRLPATLASNWYIRCRLRPA